jgi:hypothetical protein
LDIAPVLVSRVPASSSSIPLSASISRGFRIVSGALLTSAPASIKSLTTSVWSFAADQRCDELRQMRVRSRGLELTYQGAPAVWSSERRIHATSKHSLDMLNVAARSCRVQGISSSRNMGVLLRAMIGKNVCEFVMYWKSADHRPGCLASGHLSMIDVCALIKKETRAIRVIRSGGDMQTCHAV